MNERVRKTLVFLTLPAVVIWGIYNYPSETTTSPSAIENPTLESDSGAVATVLAPQPDTRFINIEQQTAADWGLDPFRCGRIRATETAAPAGQQLSWVLKGIVYSAEAPVAYVNNHSVRVGDVVDKARVVEINKKSVTLDYNGRQIQLTVSKG
jgi:hypothetical protein